MRKKGRNNKCNYSNNTQRGRGNWREFVYIDNISHNFVDEWRILISGKYWTSKAVAQRKS